MEVNFQTYNSAALPLGAEIPWYQPSRGLGGPPKKDTIINCLNIFGWNLQNNVSKFGIQYNIQYNRLNFTFLKRRSIVCVRYEVVSSSYIYNNFKKFQQDDTLQYFIISLFVHPRCCEYS
jgi:hypothetical protein